MIELLSRPWPWWVTGPLIGLIVPALLLFGGKRFGISSSLRHVCALAAPGSLSYFRYDWKREGAWSLAFVAGLVVAGVVAGTLLASPDSTIDVAESTRADLSGLGLTDEEGLVPDDLISWAALASPAGAICLVAGGFLLGFGARWGGGCTSGHAVSGLAELQLPSLVAVLGFFAGGLFVTWVLLPILLGGSAS